MELKSNKSKLSLKEIRELKEQKTKVTKVVEPKIEEPYYPSPAVMESVKITETISPRITEDDSTKAMISAILEGVNIESNKEKASKKIIDSDLQPTTFDISKLNTSKVYKLAYVPEDIIKAINDIIEAPIDASFELGNKRYGILDLDRTMGDEHINE